MRCGRVCELSPVWGDSSPSDVVPLELAQGHEELCLLVSTSDVAFVFTSTPLRRMGPGNPEGRSRNRPHVWK